jgi:transposase
VNVNGTSVGVNVHAPWVVRHAVDERTHRIEEARWCPDRGEILDWGLRLRGPVLVAYDASTPSVSRDSIPPNPLSPWCP